MGYRPLESIKTLSFATITNVIFSAVDKLWISKAINLRPKAQIHTAIQDGKYALSASISQSATGTTISDDVNWFL